MGQIKLTVGLLMTVLFTVAIIVFAINFGIDNNSAVLLSSEQNYSNIESDLTNSIQQYSEDSETSITTGMSTTQDKGDQSASSGGQFKVGVLTALSMTTTMLWVGFEKIFGEDSGFGIFLTALISMITWMIGLYVWKSWRGNPD